MPVVNKEYKDRLFSFLFGSEENKEWTLSLYNAVNNSAYKDVNAIQIKTIREVLYLGMHDDVSFQISDEINLYEQQSSFNPNMPLRQMQYAGNIYERYVTENKLNKYGKTLLSLPVPKLITFYNGSDEQPDEMILRLSDSFPEGSESDIEVTVRMININYGRNHELLEACKPLEEYSWLIHQIQENRKVMEIEEAVEKAVNEMPDEFIIKPFLNAHRSEVYGMLLVEYNEAEAMELFKEDGRKEGVLDTLVSLVHDGILSVKDAAVRADMAEDSFAKLLTEK